MRVLNYEEIYEINGGKGKFFDIVTATVFGATVGAIIGAVTGGPAGAVAGAIAGGYNATAAAVIKQGAEGLAEL